LDRVLSGPEARTYYAGFGSFHWAYMMQNQELMHFDADLNPATKTMQLRPRLCLVSDPTLKVSRKTTVSQKQLENFQ
jgi:hypothetical protein